MSLLPEGISFPFDFGFIPSTKGQDGGLRTSRLDQIEEFFVSYNKLRGKEFKVKKRSGPQAALRLLKAGMSLFEKEK